MICLNAVAAGCGTDDGVASPNPRDDHDTASEWVGIVSNATRAIPDADGSVAFVSLPTGTVEAGTRATIVNVRTNRQITVAVTDGGFNPVRIAATTGDSLRIQVAAPTGPLLYKTVVPAVRRPVVVRTEPLSGATVGIPTRSVFLVVFSEPMRESDAVRLVRDSVPVPGEVRLVGSDRLQVTFTPNAPLEYGTSYDFEVGRQAVDLDGESLEEPFRLAVSTRTQGPSPVLSVTFSVLEYVDGEQWTYAPQLLVTADAAGGDAIVDRAQILIPGLGSLGACWADGWIARGNTTQLFGEAYGDWQFTISSSTRATGMVATAIITYSNTDGEAESFTATGPIVAAGLPTTYSAGRSPSVGQC